MIRAWRNLLLLLALSAAFAVPATTTAQQSVGLSLIGKERGIDEGDQADPKAERQRLKIAELKLDAKIAGPLADVELELLIASNSQDQDSVDEARLTLTLPQDAVITGYALDVGGQMIPGQLLEQAKARNIYEDKVRQGIDPGLAEVSAQNVFTTRIYPVSAEQPRRVRIKYSAPFDPSRGLAVPLDSDLAIGRAHVTIAAQGFAGAPALQLAGRDVPMQIQGATWRGSSDLANARLAGGLTLRGKLAAALTITNHANGRSFFVIADGAGPAPPEATAAAIAASSSGRLRIYWDRSLSHRGPQTADEIDAVVALAEAARAEAVDLVTYASDAPQLITVQGSAALRAALGQVTYRGATSLAGLDALRLPEAQRCVLVSDGQLTLDRASAFRPDCRLSTLSADPGADSARLGRMAQRQQGQFVRVGPGKGREAAAALTESGYSVTSVRSDDGARIAWRAVAAPAGGWMVVGELPFDTRLPSPGPIRLRVAGPGGAVIEHLYEADGAAYPVNAAGALWASDRVAELGDDPAVHEQMVKLAKAFQVAGPNMSFLVLDRPDQYLAADIAPPAGFPKDWLEEYRTAQQDQASEQRDAKAERLSFVLKEWQSRKTWWNTRFTARKRPQREDKSAPQPVPVPPPAMISAPPARAVPAPANEDAMAAASDDSPSAEVIVTGTRRSEPSGMSASPVTTVSGANNAQIEVKLETMLADREYLTALTAAPEGQRLAVLAAQEAKFGTVPTFYLDTAEWFRLKGDAATARQLLLSALDLPGSDDETLQIVAFRLERDGDFDTAVQLAERLAAGASFRPQPARALALALAARGQARGPAGLPDLERAFGLLTKVALDPALEGNDYDGLEVIALMEANTLIPRIDALDGEWKLDQRLVGLLDTDARIVIEWTADDADIDLWVTEPNGDEVMYSSKLSSAGGQISNDMTNGYGPEEYAIHRAPTGEYQVRVNGFDADRINPNGVGHVLVRLVRNFGRPSERAILVDVDLTYQKGSDRNDDDEMKPVALLRVR